EFTAVLVKGRGNYLSRRRLSGATRRAGSLFHREEDLRHLQQLTDWSRETHDGSLSDLDFRPGPRVWDEVQSEHGNCMGRRCPTHQQCFYYAARRRIHNTQLLIVNHALFFSDLALRRSGLSMLPDYDAVVIDEAHTMDAAAGSHLGARVSSSQVDYLLNKLYNDRTNKGLLVHHGWSDCLKRVNHCREQSRDFFNAVTDRLDPLGGDAQRVSQADPTPNILGQALEQLADAVRDRAEQLDDDEEQQDCRSACDRAAGLAAEVQAWLRQSMEDSVYWIETSGGRTPRVQLESAPLDLGPALRESLFEQVPSVIMTSATLTVGRERGFEFFKTQIGLSQADELRLGSPFDYQQQARIVLPRGMPDPVRESREFELKAADAIRSFAGETDGRAFILFTSYQMMRNVERALRPWLTQRNLAVLMQGEGLPRGRMLERFKANPRCLLLGTDSFWQGVDVPGDALQLVVIAKLPFSVPDHPLLSARLDAVRRGGGNPFLEYQLPEAVIRLKQGFGRLIRSKTDTGTVVILDPRITSKPYGRVFLDSLPDCEVLRPHLASLE
ncbi:MAG: helicase, partial [Planctomycetales bacterium]